MTNSVIIPSPKSSGSRQRLDWDILTLDMAVPALRRDTAKKFVTEQHFRNMRKHCKDSVYIDLIQYTDYIWLSDDPQISMMRSFFAPPKSTPPAVDLDTNNNPDELANISGLDMDWTWGEFAEAVTYWSDEEDLDDEPLLPTANLNEIDSSLSSSAALPRKRQKLDVPYRVQVAQKSDAYKQQQAA